MTSARSGTSIPAGLLHGLAEGRAVGKGRIARDALGQEHGPVNGQVLEELLGALVRVEHAQLQVEDGLARHGEIEMAGLDDAGMHRPHGNLKDAFAQRGPVDVLLAFEGRQHRVASGKSLRRGCTSGQLSCSATRRGLGWPSASMPNQSWISRSCQLTAGSSAASEGKRGSSGGNGRAEDQIAGVAAAARRRSSCRRRLPAATRSSAKTVDQARAVRWRCRRRTSAMAGTSAMATPA